MASLQKPPTLIVSLDLPISDAVKLVHDLNPVSDKLAGFKISSLQALEVGLKSAVAELRQFSDLSIIYDHQKGGTDIPAIVEKQVKAVADAGMDYFIAVPQGAGSKSLESFVNACKENGIEPIVLLEMTHPGANDYLKEDTAKLIFDKAIELGVRHLVVPGNKIESIKKYMGWIGDQDIKLMSPGIGAQGGSVKEAVQAGVDYPIIGRAIYQAENPVEAVEKMHAEMK